MFSRNFIYIDDYLQNKLQDASITIAGCGLGSYIAECLIRTGFNKIKMIDGDKIELSNLNRQNFTSKDINQSKASTAYNRMRSISFSNHYSFVDSFINTDNFEDLIGMPDVIINAVDLDESNISKLIADYAYSNNIPCIIPINFGFYSVCLLADSSNGFLNTFEGLLNHIRMNSTNESFNGDFDLYYTKFKEVSPSFYPQLAIGSFYTAGHVTELVLESTKGNPLPHFTIRGKQ